MASAGRTVISVPSAPDRISLACAASQTACSSRSFCDSGPWYSFLPFQVLIGSLGSHFSESIA